MPVRFTTPSLGGQNGQDVGTREWQIGVAYRRLTADKWFVGHEERADAAPFGKPLSLNINSVDITVRYGLTSRVNFALTLPFSRGVQQRFYADGQPHRVSATGLGDVNFIGNFWLRDPIANPSRNLAIGVGVKAPTGNNSVMDDFFTTAGTTRAPVDQSIQLGDGALGIILQAQAFDRLTDNLFGYLSGSYLVSPKTKTNVQFIKADGTGSGIFLSVPDVYSARAGVARTIWPAYDVMVSVGARLDGIPLRDLIGGGDDGFRRPGYSLYADPGLSFSAARGTFTLSAPLRVGLDFKPDLTKGHPVGGDLAHYLVFAGYTVRF
ncbi:MAG: hypothetical protein JWL61_3977 [Gemmatimonadetes bacterium]|nr:hypothetical protein [Gemmatimonadota bacterium]